jgi:hypothetical protein
MKRLLLLAAAGITLGSLAAAPQEKPREDKSKENKAPLTAGNNIPGPFHPFNVTGAQKGHFHCLVSQYDLDPVVMILTRDLDFSQPLKDLLSQLDTAIDKNPALRLRCFVVFISDELTNVAENDDKREELVKKIEPLGANLKHVVLCLDGKADLEKYGLDDNTFATIVLYRRLQIVASKVLGRDNFNSAAVKEVMADVVAKLGATKK